MEKKVKLNLNKNSGGWFFLANFLYVQFNSQSKYVNSFLVFKEEPNSQWAES